MNSPGSTTPHMRAWPPPLSLPAAAAAELAQLEARLGQFADAQAREGLARIGEVAAARVLRQIGESRNVKTLSGFIKYMVREEDKATKENETMRRNARGIATAESRACSSGPSRGEVSVSGPLHHDDVQMEDLSNNARMEAESPAHQTRYSSVRADPVGMELENRPGSVSLGLPNTVPVGVASHVPGMVPLMPNQRGMEAGFVDHSSFRIRMQEQVQPLQADSPTRPLVHRVPEHAMMQVGRPGGGGVSELQHRVGYESPVRQTIQLLPGMDSTPSPVRRITERVQQMGGPSVGVGTPPANTLRATASPRMLALGELEFVRLFLIYVYLAGKKIEDVGVLNEDYIRFLKPLPMDHYESEIWNSFGHKFVAESERRKNLDWDPSKTRVYHCNIEKRDDSIVTIFKGPYIENTRTHLQKVVGDDNVLVVKFSDISGHTNAAVRFGTNCLFYSQVAEDGIILGLRRYRFFIYKDGGKEKKRKEQKKNERNGKCTSSVRCYFVRTESGWDSDAPYFFWNKTIDEARKHFMHIHTVPTVAKYLARFALILSKTMTLDVDLSTVNIIIVDDIPCKGESGNIILNQEGEALIHTDGTGLISENLAKRCPASVFKGNFLRTHDLQGTVDSEKNQYSAEHPLLMQFRMFYNGSAVKGTFLVDKRLPDSTIHIRPSMIKVKADPNLLGGQSFNTLEIVTTSKRPRSAFTSRSLITLLHHGGVPAYYFMELLGKALQDIEKAHHKVRYSLDVAFNHADMDDSMSVRMILSGIQPKDEAYLESQLALMIRGERKAIKQGKIPIDQCYHLMGTTDPTGTLKPKEVCVILDKGQVSGEVLVYKFPGLHFGDVHVLTARYIPGLEKIVGNSTDAILFPTSGSRSLADEMANSDYDGDMYWVSRNPQLLEYFKPSEPWVQEKPAKKTEQKKPQDFNGSELESLLFHKFLRTRFAPSYVMGTAADCWLTYMDRLLTCEVHKNEMEMKSIKTKLLELVDIYYEALDAPKTGNEINVPDRLKVKTYPHFMEKEAFPSYHSISVLGKIYDEANDRLFDIDPLIKISPMTCFTQEVVTKERDIWITRYRAYLRESSSLIKVEPKEEKNLRFRKLYQKYKQILYDAAEFEDTPRSRFEVYKEACAIYQIVYEYAFPGNEVGKCGFAWKVAGAALCEFYALKHGRPTVLCSLQVLQDAFKKDRSA